MIEFLPKGIILVCTVDEGGIFGVEDANRLPADHSTSVEEWWLERSKTRDFGTLFASQDKSIYLVSKFSRDRKKN